MVKKQTQAVPVAVTDVSTGFTPPLTLDAFQRDVVVLFVQQMRTMAWMTGGDAHYQNALYQLIDRKPAHLHDIYSPDLRIEDLGIAWDDVRNTDFAKYLYSMYEFGCLGIIDTSLEAMEDESAFTWLSAILYDLNRSAFLNEWSGGYSGEGTESAQTCYEIAELANARRVLETGRPFSYMVSAHGVDEQGIEDEQLTVRQLALLSGMEEMSIRAAANPNRANPLPTIEAERREKRTRFAVADAKVWLQSKGRYVPVVRQHRGGDIDLMTRRFQTVDELKDVLEQRLLFIFSGEAGAALKEQARALYKRFGISHLDRDALSDADFLNAFATILQFPQELLALRVREAFIRSELADVELQLRNATQPTQ